MKSVSWSVMRFLPKAVAVPEVGASSPESMLMIVVFPAPLWPRRTRISLRKSVNDK